MTTSHEHLRVERPINGVVLATLNRPERRNALTREMFDCLAALQADVDAEPATRVLVLTGAGLGFCAGIDLDIAAELPEMGADEIYAEQQHWANTIAGFSRMRTPVIAAVTGAAAGAGLSLALAADIRICTPSARFNVAFVRIGLSAGDVGCSWALLRIVRARPGDGDHAHRPVRGCRGSGRDRARLPGRSEAELLDRALETAAAISANSPFRIQLSKEVVHANVDAPSLEAALELENRNQVLASRSPDMIEALSAFREKRPPRYGVR